MCPCVYICIIYTYVYCSFFNKHCVLQRRYFGRISGYLVHEDSARTFVSRISSQPVSVFWSLCYHLFQMYCLNVLEKQKLYSNQTQMILNNCKPWKTLPSMVQISADFSGKDILVAFFQLQRPLEVVRVNSEEIKT